MAFNISSFVNRLHTVFPILQSYEYPWQITEQLGNILSQLIKTLSTDEYDIRDGNAIHKTATIESNVTIKDGIIVLPHSIVRSGAYFRGPNLMGSHVNVGANCEIKNSLLFDYARIAHLNYVGNSIVGEDVNIEGGAILANHFNERTDKIISVIMDGKKFKTDVTKFGSLLGDSCRVGANAVLSPGTILMPHSIVKRLELIDQAG